MTKPIHKALHSRRFVRRLADRIATDLFRSGSGEIAITLKLEMKDGTFGGGWCRKAVRDRIAILLKSQND